MAHHQSKIRNLQSAIKRSKNLNKVRNPFKRQLGIGKNLLGLG